MYKHPHMTTLIACNDISCIRRTRLLRVDGLRVDKFVIVSRQFDGSRLLYTVDYESFKLCNQQKMLPLIYIYCIRGMNNSYDYNHKNSCYLPQPRKKSTSSITVAFSISYLFPLLLHPHPDRLPYHYLSFLPHPHHHLHHQVYYCYDYPY